MAPSAGTSCAILAIWTAIRHNQRVNTAAEPTGLRPHWTILEVLRWTTGRFERHGIASARLDAELLATRAFRRTRVELYMHFDQPLDEGELSAYRGLVARRLENEPIAYILGRKEFWSLDLEVGPDVLVPRPDTETLVEQALELLRGMPGAGPRRVADVGTGSGAVALALKKESLADEIFATDLSPAALEVARGNALRLGLAVTFAQGDLVAPLIATAPYHVIASNPPYIPTPDLAGLPADVRQEPRLALDGGEDGLMVIRRLAAAAAELLGPGGALAVEIGAGQTAAVAAVFSANGYTRIGTRQDLAGIERVVFGTRGE
jgi:release factor glutamine methyltransferase